MDAIDSLVGVIAAIFTIVAVVLAIEYRKKDQQRKACDELIKHLNEWHDALWDVIKTEDLGKLKDYGSMVNERIAKIQAFQDKVKYQGLLKSILSDTEKFPEFADVNDAVKHFQDAAIEVKGNAMSDLKDMITGVGYWGEAKLKERDKYERRRDESLEKIQSAYDKAIAEILKLKKRI